jgi:tetratricopeptide (TPR) repeat protein
VYIGNNPDMVETLTIRPGWKWARLVQEPLASEPDNVTALHRLGLIAYRRRDFSEAARRYRHAVEVNPHNARLRNSLAHCLQALGETEESLHQFREGVRIDPTDWSARANFASALDVLGMAYAAAGRFPDAIQAAERAAAAARAAGNTNLTAGIEQRRDLYKEGRPYRFRIPGR